MLLAVLSDTHGRIPQTEQAARIIHERGVAQVIHCGDVDQASLVRHLPGGTHFVWGNCDYDRKGIERAVADIAGVHHGAWGHLDIAGRSIAFVHGDDRQLLQDLERGDAFDFLFYGHTHIAREHTTGRTRVINPGALHRAAIKTFVILNLESGELESITVE